MTSRLSPSQRLKHPCKASEEQWAIPDVSVKAASLKAGAITTPFSGRWRIGQPMNRLEGIQHETTEDQTDRYPMIT